MRELMNKAGEIGQDNLIAGVFPPVEFTGVKIAAGQGALRRGTVLAEGDAQKRSDIRFLAPLPLFNGDGTVKS